MREIIFRGKWLDNGEWVEGDLYHRNEEVLINNFYEGFNLAVDPATVGQYTGLKDKNGKRIFEGDIVIATLRRDEGMAEAIRNEKGIVGYDGIGMMGLIIYRTVRNKPVWSDFFLEISLSGMVVDYSFEIIGNIHDYPELLEGSD